MSFSGFLDGGLVCLSNQAGTHHTQREGETLFTASHPLCLVKIEVASMGAKEKYGNLSTKKRSLSLLLSLLFLSHYRSWTNKFLGTVKEDEKVLVINLRWRITRGLSAMGGRITVWADTHSLLTDVRHLCLALAVWRGRVILGEEIPHIGYIMQIILCIQPSWMASRVILFVREYHTVV